MAGELLPPGYDNVAVKRIHLYQECGAAGLLGGDQGRAAAAEQVQHVVAGLGGIGQGRAASSTGFSVK